MEIDELLEFMKKRRSIRRFKSDAVPDEHIEKILEAGRWAMSGANAQPWEFIVVRDQEKKEKIAAAWFVARKEQYQIEQTRIEELRHPQLLRPPGNNPGFKRAPVLIVVLGDRRTLQATVLSTHFIPGEGGAGVLYHKNMANATQNLHLAASALGLGSQWLSCNQVWGQALRGILDVPAILDIHSIVAVGYPAYEAEPPYRRELREIVHYENYDKSKLRTGEDVIEYLSVLRGRTKPAYSQEDNT